MLGVYALGTAPLAANDVQNYVPVTQVQAFDVFDTLLAQYANSPVMVAFVEDFADWFDGNRLSDLFYTSVWDIDQAGTYGLDLWGRILGVSRTLTIPESATYIAFQGQTTGENWNNGIWFRGADATSNVQLDNPTYLRVLLAKAMFNICNGSIPGINAILMALFPGYGNVYVVDGGDMTMQYHFDTAISDVDFAIASQDNLLPRPSGVAASIVQG